MDATYLTYSILAISISIVAWQQYRYHKLKERQYTDSLSANEREKEIEFLKKENASLKKELADHPAKIDEITRDAKRRIAHATDALELKRKMYPDIRLEMARGVFSRVEDAVWTGRTVSTIHFKGGAMCMLPVKWSRPKEIAFGTPIILRFNYATSQVIVEPLARSASTGDKKRANLRLVGSKKTEQED